jgi:hypothetical protein
MITLISDVKYVDTGANEKNVDIQYDSIIKMNDFKKGKSPLTIVR